LPQRLPRWYAATITENGFQFQFLGAAVSLDAQEMSRTLAARGLRLTRQRWAVLDAVAEASSSVSPVQVFDAARAHCPELGLTTVYRTLELLSEIGALRRVHGPDHCEAFVPAGAAHGHTVVCCRCGHVTEFTDCDMHVVVDAAARQTGYAITEHFLQLSGLCAACVAGAGRGAAGVGPVEGARGAAGGARAAARSPGDAP
jgi:Fe2+ or Zn2+ uptake regulation protein